MTVPEQLVADLIQKLILATNELDKDQYGEFRIERYMPGYVNRVAVHKLDFGPVPYVRKDTADLDGVETPAKDAAVGFMTAPV